LLVVVLIIGILASIAIPQYFKIVEKGRAAEALSALAALASAQDREMLRNAAYTATITDLDVSATGLKFFTMSTDGVVVKATRNAVTTACPSAYGCYSLSYDLSTKKISCTTAGADSCVSLQPQ
jgi:Tfp pilus assembly protein PilE